MNKQDKQLLLKVLCAMLPYGVIVNYKEGEYDFHKWKIETLHAPAYSESGLLIETNSDGWIGYTEYEGCGGSSASRALHLDKNLPYLRPMSDMTEEEKKEMLTIFETPCENHRLEVDEYCGITYTKYAKDHQLIDMYYDSEQQAIWIDWLNAHHFDYRGLIEKGLALAAPEGMYKTE